MKTNLGHVLKLNCQLGGGHSICFCNVCSLCCTVQCVQYRAVSCGWVRSSQQTRIVTSGWASVAGMTRMGVETRDEDRVPASPSSSSGASSRRYSSVTHSVLVSVVSVILISSLPTQVQSHKQCSHYYPRDDQVSSLKYFCQRPFFSAHIMLKYFVPMPSMMSSSVSVQSRSGRVHLSANVAPVMIVMFHWLGGLLHADI